MLVRYRGSPPATCPAPRETSEPQPKPACGQEEAAGAGGQWQGKHEGSGREVCYPGTQGLDLFRSYLLPPHPGYHLALPEGSDKEEDHLFGHEQLGSVEPGPVLPLLPYEALGAVWRRPLVARLICLRQLLRLCPPGFHAAGTMHGATPVMYQSGLCPGFYLLPFSSFSPLGCVGPEPFPNLCK